MILAIRYTVKGVKKAHKKYKAHQLEKEEAARGDLPDLHDPSRELDATCLAERERGASIDSSRSSSSSESTVVAEKALENDPEFQKYMEKHRSLYLKKHRGAPPSYSSVLSPQTTPDSLAPVSHQSSLGSNGAHCTCHTCVAGDWHRNSASFDSPSKDAVSELPATARPPAELPPSEKSASKLIELEDTEQPLIFEVPGDLPAILPERKSVSTTGLTATPV